MKCNFYLINEYIITPINIKIIPMQQFNYLIIDAAIAEGNINAAIALNKNYRCLLKGKSEEELESVAPYLFAINKQIIDFPNWFFGVGFNKNWGILALSNAGFEDMYNHFRKHIIVVNDDKQEVFFRFYDPAVLRMFLPSADVQQLRAFFGPVSTFIVEDEDEGFVLKFTLFNEQLQTTKITKEEFFENIKKENESDVAEKMLQSNGQEDIKSTEVKPNFGWNFIRKN